MKRRLAFLSVPVAVLATAWLLLYSPQKPTTSEQTHASTGRGDTLGILDGMTFVSRLGLTDAPADVDDHLVFADGKFVSTECDRRCGYPPAPYYVRRVGEAIEFVSESNCRDKDATLTWHGRVADGTITGRLHWVARRWYWTIEKEFWFAGELLPANAPVASSH